LELREEGGARRPPPSRGQSIFQNDLGVRGKSALVFVEMIAGGLLDMCLNSTRLEDRRQVPRAPHSRHAAHSSTNRCLPVRAMVPPPGGTLWARQTQCRLSSST